MGSGSDTGSVLFNRGNFDGVQGIILWGQNIMILVPATCQYCPKELSLTKN